MLFTLRLERKEKRMPEGPDLGLQGRGPQLRGPGVAARGLGAGALEHSGIPRWRDLVSF